jgi:hypothetical protein
MTGCDEGGRVQGSFYSTGTEPASLARMGALGIDVASELFIPRELNAGGHYVTKG